MLQVCVLDVCGSLMKRFVKGVRRVGKVLERIRNGGIFVPKGECWSVSGVRGVILEAGAAPG